MVIHGVQHAMHPPVHVAAAENDQPSFLVFIARGLARGPIAQSLARFLAIAEAQMPQFVASHGRAGVKLDGLAAIAFGSEGWLFHCDQTRSLVSGKRFRSYPRNGSGVNEVAGVRYIARPTILEALFSYR